MNLKPLTESETLLSTESGGSNSSISIAHNLEADNNLMGIRVNNVKNSDEPDAIHDSWGEGIPR